MKKSILLAFVVCLIGCNKLPAQTSKESEEKIAQANIEIARIENVKNIVRNHLKDPDSAQFRNVRKNCGEVNAKNGFGGYTGYSRFVIFENDSRVSIERGGQYQYVFDGLWKEYCK